MRYLSSNLTQRSDIVNSYKTARFGVNKLAVPLPRTLIKTYLATVQSSVAAPWNRLLLAVRQASMKNRRIR